jgi:hypothetical protein
MRSQCECGRMMVGKTVKVEVLTARTVTGDETYRLVSVDGVLHHQCVAPIRSRVWER